MSTLNPLIERLAQQRRGIRAMVNPWMQGLLQDARAAGSAEALPGGARLRVIGRQMLTVNRGDLGSIQPETIVHMAHHLQERRQVGNELLHINPVITRDANNWGELTQVHPIATTEEPSQPAEPGVLRAGSVIPRMSMFPQPGQSISSFKEQIESRPSLPKKRESSQPKPPVTPGQRLYTRVQEISERQKPGGDPSEAQTNTTDGPDTPGPAAPPTTNIQRQTDLDLVEAQSDEPLTGIPGEAFSPEPDSLIPPETPPPDTDDTPGQETRRAETKVQPEPQTPGPRAATQARPITGNRPATPAKARPGMPPQTQRPPAAQPVARPAALPVPNKAAPPASTTVAPRPSTSPPAEPAPLPRTDSETFAVPHPVERAPSEPTAPKAPQSPLPDAPHPDDIHSAGVTASPQPLSAPEISSDQPEADRPEHDPRSGENVITTFPIERERQQNTLPLARSQPAKTRRSGFPPPSSSRAPKTTSPVAALPTRAETGPLVGRSEPLAKAQPLPIIAHSDSPGQFPSATRMPVTQSPENAQTPVIPPPSASFTGPADRPPQETLAPGHTSPSPVIENASRFSALETAFNRMQQPSGEAGLPLRRLTPSAPVSNQPASHTAPASVQREPQRGLTPVSGRPAGSMPSPGNQPAAGGETAHPTEKDKSIDVVPIRQTRVVQRLFDDTMTQITGKQKTSGDSTPTSETDAGSENTYDYDQLAEQVLPFVKRLLEIERERSTGES